LGEVAHRVELDDLVGALLDALARARAFLLVDVTMPVCGSLLMAPDSQALMQGGFLQCWHMTTQKSSRNSG
jgi:hypothetical protein